MERLLEFLLGHPWLLVFLVIGILGNLGGNKQKRPQRPRTPRTPTWDEPLGSDPDEDARQAEDLGRRVRELLGEAPPREEPVVEIEPPRLVEPEELRATSQDLSGATLRERMARADTDRESASSTHMESFERDLADLSREKMGAIERGGAGVQGLSVRAATLPLGLTPRSMVAATFIFGPPRALRRYEEEGTSSMG